MIEVAILRIALQIFKQPMQPSKRIREAVSKVSAILVVLKVKGKAQHVISLLLFISLLLVSYLGVLLLFL